MRFHAPDHPDLAVHVFGRSKPVQFVNGEVETDNSAEIAVLRQSPLVVVVPDLPIEPTKDELQAKAKALDVPGRSKMDKDELAAAVAPD